MRAGLGLALALWSVSGLAAAAGGSPGIRAPEHELAGAGGLLGAVICDPLRAGLGGLGATVVLLAVLGCALVVLTGVGLRSVAVGFAGFVQFSWRHLSSAMHAVSQMGEVVVKVDGTKLVPTRDVDIDFDIDDHIPEAIPLAVVDEEPDMEADEDLPEPEPVPEVRAERPLPDKSSRTARARSGVGQRPMEAPARRDPCEVASAGDRPWRDSNCRQSARRSAGCSRCRDPTGRTHGRPDRHPLRARARVRA